MKRLCFSATAAVYHVTVMPCFDKKLEASRKEFVDAETATRDVDCVLTAAEARGWREFMLVFFSNAVDDASELVALVVHCVCPPSFCQVVDMMTADAFPFASATGSAIVGDGGDGTLEPVLHSGGDVGAGAGSASPFIRPAPSTPSWEALLCSVSSDGSALVGPGSPDSKAYGSGGFLDYVYRHAARELFGVEVPPGPLPFKRGRNPDFEEVALEVLLVVLVFFRTCTTGKTVCRVLYGRSTVSQRWCLPKRTVFGTSALLCPG